MLRITIAILLTAALFGCDGKNTENQTATSPSPAGIPAETYMGDRPADVQDLLEIKKTAVVGDTVVFLARVGGRAKPFSENQAIFITTDPSLLSCELMSDDDHCSVPWDYCCESRDAMKTGMATIRILNSDGRPIAATAEGSGGLEASKFIVVEGLISDQNDEGLFIVDASRIWVGGKPTFEEPRKGSM